MVSLLFFLENNSFLMCERSERSERTSPVSKKFYCAALLMLFYFYFYGGVFGQTLLQNAFKQL